jgi:hypothetical protein
VAASSFLRSDEVDTAEAVINFTASPGSADVNGGPVYINPAGSTSGYTLFGIAVGGSQRFKINTEGDIVTSGNIQISSSGKQFKLSTDTSDPTALGSGSLYFNTSSSKLRVYTGSTWSDISGDMTGSGTANYLTKWTASNTLGDSVIQESSGQIGIGVSPSQTLDVDGDIRIRGGEIYLDGLSSSSSTTDGTIYFDTDDNNLYVYANSAYNKIGSDLTKYTANNAVLANAGYLEVAHNEGTNDIQATGWFYDSTSSVWKSIDNLTTTVKQSLQNEFDDAASSGKIRTETVGAIGDSYVKISGNVDMGDGSDGNVIFSLNTNINTDTTISGRSCADGGDAVNYSATALTSNTASLSSSPSAGCLAANDKILLINLQGTSSSYQNVGNYEVLEVQGVSTNTVTFKTNKTKYYGDVAGSDTNIGTATTNQRVMLQRIPQYNDVTVNTGITVTPSNWNAVKGGVVAFMANGSVSINGTGTIQANSAGYRQTVDADANTTGKQAEGTPGNPLTRTTSNNASGGGGGWGAWNTVCGGGGGGGHGAAGADGQDGSGAGGTGGTAVGSSSLDTLFFGGSGGEGGDDADCGNSDPGYGGAGGGIIFISAANLTVSGSITSNGANGGPTEFSNCSANGGGGAGGSILIKGQTLALGSSLVTATGGVSNTNGERDGGVGAVGRIAAYYTNSITGTSSPGAIETDSGIYPYGVFHSTAIPTDNAMLYNLLRWEDSLATYGNVEFQTRTGNTTTPTDGTWEDWKPFTDGADYTTLEAADTHTNWSGTNATVAEGDVTRNIDHFEDEDESTAGNITKITSSTNGGYTEATISSSDISNYNYVTFWVRASQVGTVLKFGIGESAATEQTENITIDTAGTWQKVYWDTSDITSTSIDAVTKLRLTNLTSVSNTIYLDNVRAEKLLSTSSGSTITSTPNNYIQYRAVLTTTDTTAIPHLENVTIGYKNGYKIEQTDNNS